MSDGVLFVHNNFPAQFRSLAQALVARGVPCASIGSSTAPGLEGVASARYSLNRGSTNGLLPYAVRAEADLIRGANAFRVGRALKDKGIEPKVIVGHPGWGETVFLDELWPTAKRVMFSEFYYHGHGVDVGFDPEFGEPSQETVLTVKAKNAVMALALAEADAIVTPTRFQASVLPESLRARTRIIHEGVDVERIRPAPARPFALPDGRVIEPGAPVVTYANNHLEPMRGMHIVARALPRLLAEQPHARVLIFGQDSPRPYGGNSPDGRPWREVILEPLDLDLSRVHFLGKTSHDRLLEAFHLSTAHVYYTYPFVLSWSLVEAMASGCYVIGSDTPPLHDAIEDGVNGRLLPFFDVDALSQALIDACRDPSASGEMRWRARETAVANFSSRDGLQAWFEVLREVGLEIPDAPA